MHHEKEIQIPIYGGKLMIHITNSKKVASKIAGQKQYDVFAFHIRNNHEHYHIVLNPEHPKAEITYGVIAHECTHAALTLFKSRGIHPDVENQEPLAYMIEWLVDQVVKFMHEKGYEHETIN